MDTYVLKNRRTTLERIEKFISSKYFTDVNIQGRLYPKTCPVKSLSHFEADDRISYNEAINGEYKDASVGESFGPTWSTHWFRVELEIPEEWSGKEVHFLWNSNSEAMVWKDGKPLQGLSGLWEGKKNFVITEKLDKQEIRQQFYVEMACNNSFGAGKNGFINEPDLNKYYTLSQAEIAVINKEVFNLILDFEILHGMAKHLSTESERGFQALYTANRMINMINVSDETTYKSAHDVAIDFFNERNGPVCHTVHAMGHCHIDTAWLWPYAETKRKCARSWSSVIRLIEKNPDFKFTCSQAQQFAWMKSDYPSLYEDIKQYVTNGNFVPVGGTWVEMDGYLPSGESFMRQFLYGQRYFRKEFDFHCKEFWLPDTFGYSAQLPQIMKLFGIKRFLTQKLSWSLVNKFPHHSFWWEGIDGTEVLSHFPPGDSYEMGGTVQEVLKTVNNFEDKGRSTNTMFLFGYGDGGGGPTQEMIGRLQRMEDVTGLPRVKLSCPDEAFAAIENEGKNLCRWRGELYLELHNGTYTTQSQVKALNRRCEFELHDIEFLSSITHGTISSSVFKYPKSEIDRIWKLLLLNQFHDVLPGSSIHMVYEDSYKHYEDIIQTASDIRKKCVGFLMKEASSHGNATNMVFNCLSWRRIGVVSVSEDNADPSEMKTKENILHQTDYLGNSLVPVAVPSYGYFCLNFDVALSPVSCDVQNSFIIMQNGHLKAKLDRMGRLVSLKVQDHSRELIADNCFGNQFVIFDDIPLFWDAWDVMDYHLETRRPITDILEAAEVCDKGPLRVSVKVSLRISPNSTINQMIILDAGCRYIKYKTKVSWHENRKFLKVEFPTSIHTTYATYDIQFGHLQRPNHFNTSWDWARFEVCGHKWADLSDYGYGLSVLNNSKYGYSCLDNVLRLSLLRAPKAPDAEADMGDHEFIYGVMPHLGTFQDSGVIQAAYDLNCPLCVTTVTKSPDIPYQHSYFSIDNPQIVIETVKKAEDGDNIILRLYECFGGKTTANVKTSLPVKSVTRCDGMEKTIDSEKININSGTFQITLGHFEICSLMLHLQ